MGIESGAGSSFCILDFAEYRHDTRRHLSYQVRTRSSTPPRIGIIEKCREPRPAEAGAIQGVRDFIHEVDNFGFPIGIKRLL